MSENTTTNLDETEEVTAEESEASKSVDVRALGIEPLQTPIPVIAKVYRGLVETVKKFTTAVREGKSETNDPGVAAKKKLETALTSKDENIVSVRTWADNLVAKVSGVIFTDLEADNTLLTSYLVLQSVKSLVADLEDNHDYFFNRAVQSEKDRLGITVTPSEEAIQAKLACIKLNDLLQNRINIAKAMDEELPTDLFKTSDAGRVSLNTDIIPRIPKLDMGDAKSASSSTSTRLAFRFVNDNDEEVTVPADWTLNDVAHNLVSRGSYRKSGRTIERMIKDLKLSSSIGATDEEWKLTFSTGVLFGKKAQ
jgi:hypothetical protein